jgi:hypothetical protein
MHVCVINKKVEMINCRIFGELGEISKKELHDRIFTNYALLLLLYYIWPMSLCE